MKTLRRSPARTAIFALVYLFAITVFLSAQTPQEDPLARGDALRHAGDFAGALSAYREAISAQGESAEVWKRIAWAEKGRLHYAAARRALEKALALDPNDQEARDDLASLKLSRGLTVRGWWGGTEPGTSRTAVDSELWYGGFDSFELLAGGGWTDNIFYESWKAFATSYWHFLPESYLKLGLSFRGYDYTGASKPAPDSSAYQYDPRLQVEVSHWFTRHLRASLAYQPETPNFQYDPSTWIMTHKLAGELETRFGGFHVWATGATLYDPDPGRTVVARSPGNPLATTTIVVYRFDWLYGAGASYEARFWSLGARFLTNRDLDSSYAWSTISWFTLQPVERLSFDLQWILDRYSASAGAPYAGKYGSILWGTVGCEVLRSLRLSAGAKWVTNPGPTSVTNATPRSDVSLLLSLQYRTGL